MKTRLATSTILAFAALYLMGNGLATSIELSRRQNPTDSDEITCHALFNCPNIGDQIAQFTPEVLIYMTGRAGSGYAVFGGHDLTYNLNHVNYQAPVYGGYALLPGLSSLMYIYLLSTIIAPLTLPPSAHGAVLRVKELALLYAT